jgi:hypothetical protein
MQRIGPLSPLVAEYSCVRSAQRYKLHGADHGPSHWATTLAPDAQGLPNGRTPAAWFYRLATFARSNARCPLIQPEWG